MSSDYLILDVYSQIIDSDKGSIPLKSFSHTFEALLKKVIILQNNLAKDHPRILQSLFNFLILSFEKARPDHLKHIFSLINAGKNFFIANMTELLARSKSILVIKFLQFYYSHYPVDELQNSSSKLHSSKTLLNDSSMIDSLIQMIQNDDFPLDDFQFEILHLFTQISDKKFEIFEKISSSCLFNIISTHVLKVLIDLKKAYDSKISNSKVFF